MASKLHAPEQPMDQGRNQEEKLNKAIETLRQVRMDWHHTETNGVEMSQSEEGSS